MRTGLVVIAILALVGYVAVAFVLPQMQGAEVKIAAKNDPKHGELKWLVSADGAIRGWNEKNALEITLTPALQGGKATWNCKGYPVNAMPQACGGR